MKPGKGYYFLRVAPWLWMALIFWLSSRPTLPSAPTYWLDVLFKKSGHMVMFGVLAFLWYRALRTWDIPSHRARSWALAFTVVYALTDEFHQRFVPGRTPRFTDVLIDTVGATFSLYWRRIPPGTGEPLR